MERASARASTTTRAMRMGLSPCVVDAARVTGGAIARQQIAATRLALACVLITSAVLRELKVRGIPIRQEALPPHRSIHSRPVIPPVCEVSGTVMNAHR